MARNRDECDVVQEFTSILDLKNKTNGTRYIYKKVLDGNDPCKPDGYYYADGVTFILDAKAENKDFTGQLESYMSKEKNENFIGFKYSKDKFECYVKGVLKELETEPKKYDYYISNYFSHINKTNERIVSDSAKKLANLFRDSGINKQMNVPFIGAVMLCLKNSEHDKLPEIFVADNTKNLMKQISWKINDIVLETDPPERKESLYKQKSISWWLIN